MKKTITRTDGIEEVIEGTPEEIALYEQHLQANGLLEQPKKTNKKLLKG
jgi:hypothetical protein